ncbi:MAG: TolC family protein [Chthoniobacterales bacterium]|nr:TolC family protein [Chthoniobacterales bacterium]
MKTLTLLLLTTLSLHAEHAGDDGARATASSSPLSLREVTRNVVAQNPAIREALRKWEAAKQRVAQEGAWDDLRVSGTSTVRRYVDIPPNAFTDQMVSVEQAIPISGKNRARARAAAAEAVAAFEAVRRQEFDAIAKARSAYFRLANGYAQIELNRRNYTSLTQIAEISRSRYEVGTQNAADVLMSETEAAKLVEMRRDLERNVASAQSQLNVLMNRDAFAPLGIPAEPPALHAELTAEKLRPLVVANQPEIRTARARAAAEQARVQLAQRAWIPDPSLKVEGQRYNDATRDLSEVDAGISFNIPWGNARKYSAAISEARLNLAAAQAATERAETEAIGALRDALQKAETAHHHVELFRDKLVPQARQTFEASQIAYESGKMPFGEWIAAQRSVRDLEAEAREHLTDYQIALAELESVVGADLHVFPTAQSQPNK